MKPSGVLTLLTDFGMADGYVAAMKGVILGTTPGLSLVDVTHLVPRHDVAAGALVLASVAGHFPPGTVHLAVVDPGVGSARSAVAVETDRAWLVGPDNGLLVRAAGEGRRRIVRIDRSLAGGRPPSPTFHGRDLFAPAAAHLAGGGALLDLGPEIEELEPLLGPEIRITGDQIDCTIVHVDHFGNLVTAVPEASLGDEPDRVFVEVANRRIQGLSRTYSDRQRGALMALVGSDGTLEVAVREGSASELLGVARGEALRVILGRAGRLAPGGERE